MEPFLAGGTSATNPILKALRWVVGEMWEKINIVGTAKELRALGKKYGLRFFIAAVVWELIEDGLFPYLAWKNGVPALIPFFLIFHFEPVVYPAFFWAFRMYDRSRGKEPWEPDRSAYSSYWRSLCKVLLYMMATTGYLVMVPYTMGFSPRVMSFYVPLMTAFGFIHERVWHDSNYGIDQNDVVQFKRVAAKGLTYAMVSTTILGSLFKAAYMTIPWHVLLTCQVTAVSMYLFFEAVWSRSAWGISPVSRIQRLAEDSWASCVLVFNDEGQILMLDSPRRGYELPGGKRENGETPAAAAKREMREETGLMPTSPLRLIYAATGNSGKPVATYATSSAGEPTSGREGRVFWGDPKLLLIETNTYAAYNREVLRFAGILK